MWLCCRWINLVLSSSMAQPLLPPQDKTSYVNLGGLCCTNCHVCMLKQWCNVEWMIWWRVWYMYVANWLWRRTWWYLAMFLKKGKKKKVWTYVEVRLYVLCWNSMEASCGGGALLCLWSCAFSSIYYYYAIYLLGSVMLCQHYIIDICLLWLLLSWRREKVACVWALQEMNVRRVYYAVTAVTFFYVTLCCMSF